MSDLKINVRKNMFVPILNPQDLTIVIATILNCQRTSFPLMYLGLLLSTRKPYKLAYQPIIEAVQNTIEWRQENILSYGGRVTLAKSVVTVIPLHYMQVLKLSRGVIKHIDRLRRGFLWKGTEQCMPINCLVN
jgi:hypothetical protein